MGAGLLALLGAIRKRCSIWLAGVALRDIQLRSFTPDGLIKGPIAPPPPHGVRSIST